MSEDEIKKTGVPGTSSPTFGKDPGTDATTTGDPKAKGRRRITGYDAEHPDLSGSKVG